MFAFIARQPILTGEKEVFAYELLFRDGKNNCFPEPSDDERRTGKDTLKLELDEISCQKISFINFNKRTLIEGLPTSLDPNNVVVEIGNDTTFDNSFVDTCKKIKDQGFKIAVDKPLTPEDSKLIMPVIDILKVDVHHHPIEQWSDSVCLWHDHGIKLVAEQVDSQRRFSDCLELGFDYFQGYFFSRPESFTKKPLPSAKLTLMDLVAESSKPTFALERVNEIIERDAGLSYMLLRFINNPLINKRQKITSLKHALNYMGEVEVKKFIALLAMANLADEKPLELLHLSLVRAKFCDLMAHEKHVGDNPPLGFLVGLFSLLDALLDQKMQDAVAQLPVVDEVKFALCGGKNELALYLNLAKAFESATWLKVKRACDVLGIDQRRCHSIFNQAVLWGNSVRQTISPHFPKPLVRK